MKKNDFSISDIFVKKLWEKMWKLLTRDDLVDIWVLSGGSKSRVAYGIGKMKNQWIIESIGGGVYFVPQDSGLSLWSHLLSYWHRKDLFWETDSEQFSRSSEWQGQGKAWEKQDLDTLYWQIVALLIKIHSPSGAIIAHEKSAEYHLRDYSAPERLVLYTRDTEKRVRVGKYEYHFRTLQSGEKSGNKNMYRVLHDPSVVGEIDGVKLRFLSIEASLLDLASLRVHDVWVADDLVLRFLRRYESSLSREALGELVRYRYIRAMNRIRKIAKDHGYDRLYEMSLDIIRREGGGCYLNL